ncbi:hypothetical protein MCOR25_005138 [Pyricularia grisea]|uniref:MYND-type domain-containing protein n=1 Tax=Pyricularia grisea TaxID=148305 RepID=A0A6P8B8X2_PYRGI|nr:uncharacterized protein PgNI_05120 [Pyricularia grisea]KAI6366491.1 hypothetical protein MCOR25_005138 [Pyricularia grisea]TLD12246.1 hypothetical protein PgNI_05120 [Pyricularia grisea]
MNRYNLGLQFSKCSDPACPQVVNLQRCAACKAVVYCSRDHQASDRPRHKSSCAIVKKQIAAYEAESSTLRARVCPDQHGQVLGATANFTVSALSQMFTTIAGATTQVPRSYLQARSDLVTALLNIRTGEAVDAALGHAMAMLNADRGDVLGVRSIVPTLLLRLGRDQEAYDFIKWYATVPHDTYKWGDPAEPFLNLSNEDATEELDDMTIKNLIVEKLPFLAALVLLKVRLALDLANLTEFVAKRQNTGSEEDELEAKMQWVREEAMSGILHNRQDLISRCGSSQGDALQESNKAQIKKLIAATSVRNKHYWPALHNPTQYSHGSPTVYARGSREEVILAFRETWYGWSETPQALDFIKALTSPDVGSR